MKLIGNYSSNANVDVSSYGASSASQFIAFPTSSGGASGSGGSGHTGSFGMGWINASASYAAPSLSLSGNTLRISPAYVSCSANAPSGSCSGSRAITTSVYYVG